MGSTCVNSAGYVRTHSTKFHNNVLLLLFLKKKQNAPRPSEHPPVKGGKNVKTFRWDHRLQIQNLFMTFKRVPIW